MGYCSAQVFWAVVGHNYYGLLKCTNFICTSVVQVFYGLVQCTFCMWAVVVHSFYGLF